MAQLQSSLILALVDRVTAPARGIAGTLQNLQGRLAQNTAQMEAMRGQLFGAAAAGYALFRGLSAPISAAADFETAMNQVAAVSGAGTEQLAAMQAQAKELGRTTQFTASQSADAMGFLAMAGFNAEQVLGAMPGTLQLAAAAQMDLADTADLVSNVLSGYNMEVEELGRVNDVMVQAFTSSNTNLQQLGEALKYAGPVATAAGVQFEEATAALGLMGNAGIQASMAGTSLRGAISRILAPTSQMARSMEQAGLSFTDSSGRLLPLVDIIQQLEPHADDAGLFMELFGQRAGPAMAALVSQGSDSLRELTDELENSGGKAEEIANVQMAGFNGQMKALGSAFEGLQIAVGTALLPALTRLTNSLTEMLGPLTSIAEKYPRVTAAVVALTAGLIGLRVAAIATQFAFLWMRGSVLMGTIAGLKLMAGPLALLARTFRTVAAGTVAARAALATYLVTASLAGNGAALGMVGKKLLGLLSPIRLVTVAMGALKVAMLSTGIGAALIGLATAGTWIYNNWSGIGEMFRAFGDAFIAAIGPLAPALEPVIGGLKSLVGWFGSVTGEMEGAQWTEWGTNAGAAVGNFVSDAVTALDDFKETVASIFNNIDLGAAGGQIIQSLWDGIAAKWDEFFNWLKGLPGQIGGVFSNVPGQVAGFFSGGSSPAAPVQTGNAVINGVEDPSLPAPGPPVAGAMAVGGAIVGGKTYLVGEEGPELITPRRSGWVNTAEETRSMMGGSHPQAGTVYMGDIHLHANGVNDPRRLVDMVMPVFEERIREAFSGVHADIEWAG